MTYNKIAVIGVGYVGLPLLEAFSANKSNEIKGYDISRIELTIFVIDLLIPIRIYF